MDCVFCAIATGEMETDLIAESESAVAFRDRSATAPTHVLVIPRKHIASVDEMSRLEPHLATDLLKLCAEVARAEGIVESGYRVVTNVGDDAGQSVYHVHLHVLGGRKLRETG
jgi:histidine triad (HIT) family protein